MSNKSLLFLFFLIFIANLNCQGNKEFSEYLKATQYIDSHNPKIIEKAKQLTQECKTDAEKAKALFEYVRDSYSDTSCNSYIASEIMECGGNSCRQRSILLAALCRATGIPARLHLQKVVIKNWKKSDGTVNDVTFAHGITGIFLNGNWHLYEVVGNRDKWIRWTQDQKRGLEMPVEFYPDRDCLFQPDEKIIIETLPIYFADRTEEMIGLIEKIDNF